MTMTIIRIDDERTQIESKHSIGTVKIAQKARRARTCSGAWLRMRNANEACARRTTERDGNARQKKDRDAQRRERVPLRVPLRRRCGRLTSHNGHHGAGRQRHTSGTWPVNRGRVGRLNYMGKKKILFFLNEGGLCGF